MNLVRIILSIVLLILVGAMTSPRLSVQGLRDSISGSSPADTVTSPLLKVDSSVLAAVANGGRARFLLVLRQQADLSGAATLRSKEEKGRYVYNALRAIADQTQAPVRALLDKLGLQYETFYIVNMIAVQGGTDDAVRQLAARQDIAHIEADPDIRVQLPVPAQPPQRANPQQPATVEWGVTKINAPQVWAMGFRGRGIVYANADTGVQWDHPALKNQYRGWNGTAANHDYNWWDAIHKDIDGNGTNPCGFNLSAPCDDFGHGTHTLGTGIGDDGVANQIGVAPNAKWIACRNMENGTGRPSRYIECFEFFLAPWNLQKQNPNPDKAPDVISNSYGCPLGAPPSGENCDPNSLKMAVKNERAAGIFVAVSAGNSGPGCSTVTDPPALYNASTTVGATDINDVLAGFSSRGPVTVDSSNRLKPDLSAPGVNIRSSYPTNAYATLSGTSMSSPHLAGAVALLWQARPSLRGNVSATENVLFNTANPNVTVNPPQTCGGVTTTTIPNNSFGYGRIDVLAEFNAAH